jgi:hypothetical protein
VVWQLAGQTCEGPRLLHAATWVLGGAWGISTYLAIWAGQLLMRAAPATAQLPARAAWPSATGAIVAAVAACLVFPPPVSTLLPESADYYLGLLPPNVYHNSTLIGAMPFAIAALALAFRQLRRADRPGFGADAVLALVLMAGALFKPSFAFAFVPAYGLCRLLRGRRALLRHLAGLVVVAGPVLLLIVGEAWWIAAHPEVSIQGKSEFALAFPAGWKMFLPQLTAGQAVLLGLGSFALPLLAYALQPAWLRQPAHQLALLSTFFATVQFLLVYETGQRAGHGNFTWQVVATNHWLYWLVVLETLHWQPVTRPTRIRQVILLSAIALSVMSGVVYLSTIGLMQTYR